MKLVEFKKKHKKKRESKLSPFKSEILELNNGNYSLASIQIFLEKNGVKTSQQNISKFLIKEITKKIGKEQKSQRTCIVKDETQEAEAKVESTSWEPQLKIEGNPIMDALKTRKNKENSND